MPVRALRLIFAVCLLTAMLGPQVGTQSTGPVAAYDFGDGGGLTALDWSGNGHSADLVSGPSWTASGRFGGALTFDGADDGVRLPVSTLLELTGNFSVSAWMSDSPKYLPLFDDKLMD
jgi:hypothetical protein